MHLTTGRQLGGVFRAVGLICLGLVLCVARAGEAKTRRVYGQMILPVTHRSPKTPETRALTAGEADAAMQRDWLFQAMGRPLAKRAAGEIAWARGRCQIR